MLLPQTKEREYRFKLALRIGLPIFALIVAFISHTFITNYNNLQNTFYIEAVIIITISIYFIFYLIYHGFSVKITDDVSKTFTREYLYAYLQKEIERKKNYTVALISIENLEDINTLYGIKNGDKVLREVAQWIAKYLEKEGIVNFPMGHIKAGDFILGFDGSQTKYSTTLELLALKASELKVDDIEVKISHAITDTSYSRELDYLIENLFEKLKQQQSCKQEEQLSPNELEAIVIHAIEQRNILFLKQDVYRGEQRAFYECFVKLKAANGKIIHPKAYMKVISKLGLSVSFDLIVLESLLSLFKEEKGLFALNISPSSLRNEKFLLHAKELLSESSVEVMFILFEAEYYAHINRYNAIIKSLKEYGVHFAVDRVASIHTSFLYLRELDIDVIRFDTYYANEEKFAKNRSIIEGFHLMAQQKGIASWMKNIEDESTYKLAKAIGIEYLQGKYFTNLQEIGEKR